MKYPRFEGLMTYEKNNDSKERIINASIYIFATKGYVKATTKEIASLAEVSEALVFKYFGNKQNLLGEVSLEIIHKRLPDLFLYRVDEVLGQTDGFDIARFTTLIQEKFHHVEGNIGYIKIIFIDLGYNSEVIIEDIQRVINSFVERIEAIIIKLQQMGVIKKTLSPRSVVRSFAGMMNMLMVDKNILSPNLDTDKALEEHIEILMNGVSDND